MFTQQNSLQVFVTKVAPFVTPGPISGLTVDSQIAMVDAKTGLIIAGTSAVDCYIIQKRGNSYKKSRIITDGFLWSTLTSDTSVAAVPMQQTLAIPATIQVDESYQLKVRVLAPNFNGDETKVGEYLTKTGDTPTIVAAALVASINASLTRDYIKDFTISATTGTITAVAGAQPFKVGRKPGGYTRFEMQLVSPSNIALSATDSVLPKDGKGLGYQILNQEFFARQNEDAVSINEFRTALPVKLYATESNTYKTLELRLEGKEWNVAANAIATPSHILIAQQV